MTIFKNKNYDYKIYLITTEKEKILKTFNKEKNTISLVKNIEKNHKNIFWIHYPSINGRMAHQLNYALRSNRFNSLSSEDDWVVIYNADSQPEQATFDWLIANQEKSNVFQQYGNYSKNIGNVGGFLNKNIVTSAMLWQNRWSIGSEYYNGYKAYHSKTKTDFLLKPLSYCIGHGLFMRKSLAIKTHGFSDSSHNEDTILGIELSFLHEKIYPMPYFDLSDSPYSAIGLLIQKTNWFFGPLDSFKYISIINKKHNVRGLRFIELVAWCFKLFLFGIYWIAGPSFLVFLLTTSIISKDYFIFLLFLLSIFIFLFIPNFIVNKLIFKNLIPVNIFLVFVSDFLAYFMHGISAYYAILKRIYSVLFFIDIDKQRTPTD